MRGLLLPAGRSRRTVVAGCADALSVDAADDVLDQIDVALTPVDVHLAPFLAPFRLVLLRHARIAITLRASPSLIVGFRCAFGPIFLGHAMKATPFALDRAKVLAVFFSGNAVPPL